MALMRQLSCLSHVDSVGHQHLWLGKTKQNRHNGGAFDAY